MRTKWIAVVIAVVAALALGIGLVCRGEMAWLRSAPPPATNGKKPTEIAAPVFYSGASQLARDAWRVGMQRVYDVEFGSTFGHNETPEDRLLIVGFGKLELTAASADAERVVLEARLLEPVVKLDHKERAEEHIESQLGQDFENPLVVSIRADGEIEFVAAAERMGAFAHAMLRQLVSALQFVRPQGESPSFQHWSTTEADQNGIYAARYVASGPRSFAKTKLSYRFLQMAEALGLRQDTMNQRLDATIAFDFDERGMPVNVASKEALRLSINDKAVTTESYVTLKFASGRVVEPPRRAAGLRHEALFDTRTPDRAESEAKRREQLAAGASFSELLRQVVAVPLGTDAFQQRWALIEQIAAVLAVKPETIASARAQLKQATTDAERQALLSALGEAGTPQAQAALSELGRDVDASRDTRVGALHHLGLVTEPTAATFDDLGEIALHDADVELREAATLALGGAAQKAASASNPPRESADAIRGLAQTALSGATPRDRTMALAALSNAGSPDALDTIRVCLSDPDPQIRAAAIDALRQIPDPRADSWLAEFLLHDSAPTVRVMAARTARARPYQPGLGEACWTALRVDPEASVRLAVVGLVAAKLQDEPALRALLEWVVANEQAETVKATAQETLQPSRTRRGS